MINEGHGRVAPGIPDRTSGGWLSPDGHYWACGDEQYPAVAELGAGAAPGAATHAMLPPLFPQRREAG
jgi:hypothetical protein